MLLPPPATHHHRQHHLLVDSQLLLVQLHLLKLLVQIRIRWDAGWPVLVLLELLVWWCGWWLILLLLFMLSRTHSYEDSVKLIWVFRTGVRMDAWSCVTEISGGAVLIIGT